MKDQINMSFEESYVKMKFETQWKIAEIENEIINCPNYDIFPIFRKYIKKDMKILESGCGLGRWVFYFHRLGFDITGLDWSRNTIDLIKLHDDTLKIHQGDARSSDFQDREFDLILSLGTVEHAIEGPFDALNDAFRILNNNGILIITVPIMSKSRMILSLLKDSIQNIKALFRCKYLELRKIKKDKVDNLYMNICYENKRYNFFEYRTPLNKFKRYVESSGFHVIEIFPAFYNDGLYQDLGSFVGKWNYEKGTYEKNIIGKIISKYFPKAFPHMICCVAEKMIE